MHRTARVGNGLRRCSVIGATQDESSRGTVALRFPAEPIREFLWSTAPSTRGADGSRLAGVRRW
jgi:hypothetical protein